MPLPARPSDEAPSGLPDGEDEITPLGVPDSDRDDEQDVEDGEAMPGIPTEGEPDTAG
ncbi:MAG: hypothetical protein H0T43_00535 [Solirubrobacterales bacterium]|nr:hypothetical protein [Solirubrobacterales bacterium]